MLFSQRDSQDAKLKMKSSIFKARVMIFHAKFFALKVEYEIKSDSFKQTFVKKIMV